MKKTVVLLMILLCLLLAIPAGAEEPAGEMSEWTVMFYFCGSDLESGHSYATGNLKEISYCLTYQTLTSARLDQPDKTLDIEDVNVVIETGGCKQWHAQELGMNVKTDVLQRWHFRPAKNVNEMSIKELGQNVDMKDVRDILTSYATAIHENARFDLDQELPLASMAAPDTLTDFIRWSAETYPAKKYALVLWDHGTGAVKGLLIDELFNGDTLGLSELKKALADSGVHFEAVLFDACLMANLETACAIKDSANWMIASEEVVAGKGTAMYSWLQQLYSTPRWDGQRLGRWVCEMTQEKYAKENSGQSENTLTWSVIDLSKIDRLATAFDSFFKICNDVYLNDPGSMVAICEVLNGAFEFGLGDAHMIDLARIPYHPFCTIGLNEEMYVELMDALAEAVAFNTHGPDRASAGGLSFCYAASLAPKELDAYAKVCPSNNYLALLDAINPNWNAPESVYETAAKLTKIDQLPAYQITAEKVVLEDGTPGLAIVDGFASLWDVSVNVYRLNPKTGNTVCLGDVYAEAQANIPGNRITYGLTGFTNWATVEGVHCSAEIVSSDYSGRELYNIPIRMDDETYLLRCGTEDFNGNGAVIYGLWEGYNADSGVFGRNVVPLAKVAGRDFCLLYAIDGTENTRTRYETSETLTMLRSLEITRKKLPAGTYYMEYWAEDLFKRALPVGRVEINWDGKSTLTISPNSNWEGTIRLTLEGK